MVAHPVVKVAFAGAWAAGAITSHLSVGDYVVVIGAICFALASLRSGRAKVLRDTNIDLKTRNDQLETATRHLLSENQRLEQQPNLEKHAQLLDAMLASLKDHDRRAQEVWADIHEAFQITLRKLEEIRTAVVPPH